MSVTTTVTPNKGAQAGIGMVLLAFFLFSIVDTSTKWLAIAGIASLQLAFMRYFTHFVISTGRSFSGGWTNPFACDQPGLVAFRGGLLALSTVLNFISIKYLPLPLIATIMFTAPLLVALMSWPILKEPVGPLRWIAIVFGFVGVVIAIRPFDGAIHWSVFVSCTAAITFAAYSVTTRQLSGKVTVDTQQFYTGFVGTAVLLPFAIFQWSNPASGLDWLLLFGLGAFAWAGHQLLTRAHAMAPANLLMPFSYSFMLYLTVWSILIFKYVPDVWNLVGAAIVIGASLLNWQSSRR